MASPSHSPISPITGEPKPFRNGSSSHNGLPVQLNISGNGSASIYYFDRPGTYNIWLAPNGAPQSAEYIQPNRKNASQQTGSASIQQGSQISKIPVLKR